MSLRHSALLLGTLGVSVVIVPGCATTTAGAGAADDSRADIPVDAVPVTRREANGDTVTEYRVGGRMRALKVQPSRGPAYYVYDRDGDGIIDDAGDHPPQTYFKLFEWK